MSKEKKCKVCDGEGYHKLSCSNNVNRPKKINVDKLLKLEKELTMMFDSDVRVALALLEEIRKLKPKEDE